jgi:hypothetical protein
MGFLVGGFGLSGVSVIRFDPPSNTANLPCTTKGCNTNLTCFPGASWGSGDFSIACSPKRPMLMVDGGECRGIQNVRSAAQLYSAGDIL